MSSNYSNEDGIINASPSTSQRYPLVKDPTAQLKDINYKEYLQRISENEIGIRPTSVGSGAGFNAAAAIVATLLGVAGHPGSSAIVTTLNIIIGLLWPKGETDTIIWDDLLKIAEEIVDQAVSEAVLEAANTALEEMYRVAEDYQRTLEDWVSGRRVEQAYMRGKFENAKDILNSKIANFKKPGYELPLLTMYAQAANLYLYITKDITVFGKEWGYLPEGDPEVNGQGTIDYIYEKEFLYHMSEHSEYCVKWYNEGLNRLPRSSFIDWIDYNRYRREMTLLVLDIISLFPSYDAFVYPMLTNPEITREVYTDPLVMGSDYGQVGFAFAFGNIEELTRKPHLFDWLNSLTIYTQEIHAADDVWNCFIKGTKSKLSYTNSSGTFELGGTMSSTYEDTYDVKSKDIYQTLLNIGSDYGGTSSESSMIIGCVGGDFNYISESGSTGSFHHGHCGLGSMVTVDSLLQLPLEDESDVSSYTHRLSYMNFAYDDYFESFRKDRSDYRSVGIQGWTHTSVSPENYIHRDKITQLYGVKGNHLSNASVEVGPGFLGGNIIKCNTDGGSYGGSVDFTIRLDGPDSAFRIRIPYAAETDGVFSITIRDEFGPYTIEQGFVATMDPGDPLSYEKIKYFEFDKTLNMGERHGAFFVKVKDLIDRSANVYWHKVEIVPVDENYDERVTLEKAQKAVNALFTAGRNALPKDVTDFKVDQVSILVDCVSGELYPNEKRELLSLVKYTKRLSYSRNLLLDPTFDSINSSEKNGWYGSKGIVIGNGDFVFKGNYVHLSGTHDTQYPTYLYQKIDESKLKEYTRYKLRGFIESSQDLEAYVIRYDAKHQTMDVSNNLLPDISPVNACGEPNRCAALPYLDENPRLECSSIQDGILSDSHSFSLNIDTGSIDFNENVGIWVLFKISTPEGYAKFGNLEVIEDGPVIGEALARVKRQETKWRNKLAQLRTETQAIYTRAKQAIDNLFTNAQDSHLKIGATFASIVAARKIVQSIREAYMSWLSIVPGVNYPIFTELNERVQQAFQLYDVRNVVRNGRFLNGVSDWIVTSDVKVQEENGNNVLVLSNWDAQVLQCLKLYQDRGYILRVTARKEGLGEGYITITDEAGHTDQLTFGTCEEIDASNTFVSTGYMTKELEFFPDTEKVRIEIGETEGIFQVESVELFLMEDLC
ncbi:insecticidal delta-endotoxin Cry8Ea1 family protein [Bacillus thuringiensis]|uniref:insecticidal delta-endotoxin Cry8Ea1 family protein n=1 Tax=Bacillus thuringiensis TaxID=1428 RepID=UPI0015940BEA|nr:insecticidal delta-endotoxin Cry8Ea1 family protein [Bacillus thuringiensis]